MDEVTMRIFRELIIHPKNSLKELENHLNLTRGQISYGLGKINDYLQDGEVGATIEKDKEGHIVVLEEIIQAYNHMDESNLTSYFFVPMKELA